MVKVAFIITNTPVALKAGDEILSYKWYKILI